MAGVSAFPMRVKCATLAWHTMKSALEGGTHRKERMSAEGETRNMEARAAEGCGLTPEELEDFTAKLVAALKIRLRSGDPGGHLRTRPYL